MKIWFPFALLITLLLIGAAFLSVKWRTSPDPPPPTQNHEHPARTTLRDAVSGREKLDRDQSALIRTDWDRLLSWLGDTPPPSPEEIRSRLMDLRSKWSHLDPHILAECLEKLLATGQNQSLHLAFEVGPHGSLAGWPDLRTFLVDVLAVADPDQSARIARELMETTPSASEFAVAIRSLIRGGPADASEPELLSSLHTLLTRPEWQNHPAMAESLDLARFLGTPQAANMLLEWEGNPQLKQMALHEFAADHPSIMTRQLADLEANSTMDLSSLMARADPADPEQAGIVDSYLRNPAVSHDHKSQFLSLYPLRSLTTGYRLYRGNPSPYDQNSVKRSDQAALRQVKEWLQDPSLESHHAALENLRDQLEEWQRDAD